MAEGLYLATSEDIQGLVAQGRTVTETIEIARDIAKKLLEAQSESGKENGNKNIKIPPEADRYKHMNEMNKQDIIEKIRNYLYQKSEIDFAYIFGSFTQKDYYNDIDMAVYIKSGFNYKNFDLYPFGYASLLSGELLKIIKNKKIDVVVMNNAGLLIQNRIVNKGLLLFDRDIFKRIYFENRIRKEYIDTEHLRKIKDFYIKEKNQ